MGEVVDSVVVLHRMVIQHASRVSWLVSQYISKAPVYKSPAPLQCYEVLVSTAHATAEIVSNRV